MLTKILDLRQKRKPFVLATVVSCEKPTSARPGAKALIQQDGTLFGWIGGSCAQPIVIREALKALEDGVPKLLKIGAPEAAMFGENNNVLNFEMTCYSGGTMEVFIEPVLQKPQLVLIGNSPDLQALACLGEVMSFELLVFDPEITPGSFPENCTLCTELDLSDIKDSPHAHIVIATHGRYDEEAVKHALSTRAPYIALIASKKRATAIFDYLKNKGVSRNDWQRVKAPAGLDIGATTPEEIAVSILAEIIEVKRRRTVVEPGADKTQTPTPGAIDPICGMSVPVDTALYKTDFQGSVFYFCCAGCQQKFESQPEKYVRQPTA
ncbi:MAG: XdhC family protein [bacterium]